jgi:hypothetical protein
MTTIGGPQYTFPGDWVNGPMQWTKPYTAKPVPGGNLPDGCTTVITNPNQPPCPAAFFDEGGGQSYPQNPNVVSRQDIIFKGGDRHDNLLAMNNGSITLRVPKPLVLNLFSRLVFCSMILFAPCTSGAEQSSIPQRIAQVLYEQSSAEQPLVSARGSYSVLDIGKPGVPTLSGDQAAWVNKVKRSRAYGPIFPELRFLMTLLDTSRGQPALLMYDGCGEAARTCGVHRLDQVQTGSPITIIGLCKE